MPPNDYNITVSKSNNKNNLIVSISGNLTIENTISIHSYLLEKALYQNAVTLCILKSAEIDLSFMQLLIGFVDTRNKESKKTEVEFSIDESMSELLEKSGFNRFDFFNKNQTK